MNPREIIMIVTLTVCLFAVLALRTSCAQGVANLFLAMEPPGVADAGPPSADAP
jgi:hypothetical protein